MERMAEYPEDVMKSARKLCDDLIQAWMLHHSREEAAQIAAVSLVAERRRCADLAYRKCAETRHVRLGAAAREAILAECCRPATVTVASANDFPDAVFSSEELANQYNEQQALTDPKVPRVYRKNATFVIDAKVKTQP